MKSSHLLFVSAFFCLLGMFSPIHSTAIDLTQEEKAWLDSKPYLTVMSLENFHPFNFRTSDDIPRGYSIDTMKLIGKILHKEIRFVKKPWNEQLEMFRHGELDIIPHIAITEERKAYTEYTDFTHLSFLAGFAIPKGQPIRSLQDLRGKKLAIVNDYYLQGHLEKQFPDISLYLAPSTLEAIQAVVEDKASAVIANIPTLSYFIQEKWLSNLKIVSLNDLGLPLEVKTPMGVSKNNAPLKSILEKAYDILAEGELPKLKQKWLFPQQKTDQTAILLPSEQAYLSHMGEIKICVDPNWLPFEHITNDRQYEGIMADYVALFSKRLNIPFTLQPTRSYAESQEKLRQGECDLIPADVATPSNQKKFLNSDVYYRAPRAFAIHIDHDIVRDFSELSNGKIGVQANSPAEVLLPKLYPGIQPIPFENTDSGLQKVANQEIDAFVTILGAISHSIQTQGIYSVKIGGVIPNEVALSMLINQNHPELVPILNKAIGTLTQKDKSSISDKWITVKYERGIDYSLLWKFFAGITLLILWILWWNRQLRQRVNQEVSRRMAFERDNIEKEKLLIQQSKMAIIGEMVNVIAHQWKQPLNIIAIEAQEIDEIIEYDDSDPNMLLDVKNDILKQVDHMTKTMTHFRDFFKPSTEVVDFDVCQITDEVRELLSAKLKNLNVEFIQHHSSCFKVSGFPSELQQVYLNILSNACDVFEEKNVPVKKIELLCFRKENRGIVQIRDTGGGIPVQLLPEKLFDPYVTTKGDKGTGIGLQMSKMIIEDKFKGKLWAHNLDQGAEFVIELPLAERS